MSVLKEELKEWFLNELILPQEQVESKINACVSFMEDLFKVARKIEVETQDSETITLARQLSIDLASYLFFLIGDDVITTDKTDKINYLLKTHYTTKDVAQLILNNNLQLNDYENKIPPSLDSIMNGPQIQETADKVTTNFIAVYGYFGFYLIRENGMITGDALNKLIIHLYNICNYADVDPREVLQ